MTEKFPHKHILEELKEIAMQIMFNMPINGTYETLRKILQKELDKELIEHQNDTEYLKLDWQKEVNQGKMNELRKTRK